MTSFMNQFLRLPVRVTAIGARMLLLGGLPFLIGCSNVHSVWNIFDRSSAKLLASTNFTPHEGLVFLTEMDLPARVSAERIAKVDVGIVRADPTEAALVMLANKARAIGANAVIQLKIWYIPNSGGANGPQASGLAVRLADTNAVSGFNGYWR